MVGLRSGALALYPGVATGCGAVFAPVSFAGTAVGRRNGVVVAGVAVAGAAGVSSEQRRGARGIRSRAFSSSRNHCGR